MIYYKNLKFIFIYFFVKIFVFYFSNIIIKEFFLINLKYFFLKIFKKLFYIKIDCTIIYYSWIVYNLNINF